MPPGHHQPRCHPELFGDAQGKLRETAAGRLLCNGKPRNRLRTALAGFVLILAIASAGCATDHRSLITDHSRPLSVPFIAQHPGQCGPAALAMVANFYGQTVTQDEIAKEIYLPDIQGTLTTELAGYAKRFGLWVRSYRGSWDDLRQKLATGVPVIVLGKIGGQFHYFVILQAGDPLIVHTDSRAFHKMSRDDFQRWWDGAGRWCLLVCPPAQATWKLSADEENDLGLFYEKTSGDLCMSEAHYRQATVLRPANSYYQLNLGNALLAQRNLKGAAAAYQHAFKLDNGNADALNNLAWTYHELGENLDEAAHLCRQAIALNPAKKAYYLDTLGSVLEKMGKRQEARAAFAEALAATTAGQQPLREAIRHRLETDQDR